MPATKYEFPADRLFITPQYLRLRYGTFDPNVFTRWQRRGWVEKLGKGVYRNDQLPKVSEDDLYVAAGLLMTPSYISLHTALSHYGLIPEYVMQMISVTTNTPIRVRRGNTVYRYRKINPALFYGYEPVTWRGATYHIARPEKAILDLAYFEPLFSDPDWLYEMRFDEWELRDLDWERMERFLQLADRATLHQRVDLLRNVYAL